jgi:hypothetical protein
MSLRPAAWYARYSSLRSLAGRWKKSQRRDLACLFAALEVRSWTSVFVYYYDIDGRIIGTLATAMTAGGNQIVKSR